MAASSHAGSHAPLAHAALDALDADDKYREPLAAWWAKHQQWHQTFPPPCLDDVVGMRPSKPPTFGHLKIRNPSPGQHDAQREAALAYEAAHKQWKQQNTQRKRDYQSKRDRSDRKRPADDGSRATAHRALHPQTKAPAAPTAEKAGTARPAASPAAAPAAASTSAKKSSQPAEAWAAEAWAAGARTASAVPMAEPAVGSLVQTAQIARPACPSPPASTDSSGDVGSDEGDQGANVGQPWAAANEPSSNLVAPPPQRTLRAPCPVRTGVARVGVGRAHQAEVPAWPHGDASRAPEAAAARERNDARVAIHDADVLRAQRTAFNARLLAAEPRRRWPDAGAQRFALGPTSARKLLAYLCDPANRNARSRLRLRDAEDTVLGGYGNYRATHAVEVGAHHSEAEQVKHTLLLSREVLELARDRLPGLDALVEGGLRQLPETQADGHELVPLHGHILDQGSGTARFADHQDTEEEVAVGARAPDRRVVYTVVIALSDGGDTAMRILGQDELAFTGEAGSGVAFRSALWHRTERAGAGVWKLAVFYGYLL